MRYLLLILSLIVWGNLSAQAPSVYTINQTKTFQTIRGFGASDAWSDELIMRMNDSTRNVAANLLFSQAINSDGTCRGAGLSIWRYNLGAGSAEQGEGSGIPDPYRRTGLIIGPDGSANPGKQPGTQWVLHAAKDRGVKTLVLFSNSPPVYLTLNGKAFSDICGKSNLAPENNDAFADYLTSSLGYFKNQGIDFDYVSPVNEPEWGWCRKDNQEGNPYESGQIAGIGEELNSRIAEKKLSAMVQIPESGLLTFINPGYKFKTSRQNHINNFFKESGKNYVGDIPGIAKQITAHSYFTEWPLWLSRKVRERVARVAGRAGIEYWMSEYCILRTTPEITGGSRDLGMHTALYVSRVMHHDLVYGNASAWCWWLGLSSANYKDGLIYCNRDGSGLTDSKLLWSMGNFSRFIHPGAVRVEVSGRQDNELLVSAYRNIDSDGLVIIVINLSPEKRSIRLKNLTGQLDAWETSETRNLVQVSSFKSADSLSVPARSVTSFISR